MSNHNSPRQDRIIDDGKLAAEQRKSLEGGMGKDLEQKAERIIAECPEVWERPCYISDVTFNALVKRIAQALADVREADAQVCDKKAYFHRNSVHGSPVRECEALECAAEIREQETP